MRSGTTILLIGAPSVSDTPSCLCDYSPLKIYVLATILLRTQAGSLARILQTRKKPRTRAKATPTISQRGQERGHGWFIVTMVSTSPNSRSAGFDEAPGTIISIYETPFPEQGGHLNRYQREILASIRRNLWNVFSQLSRVKDDRNNHPINTLEIRPGLPSNQTSNLTIADSPSLLFYYLFDDWYTTYALVAKDQHQYAQQLETLVSSPSYVFNS